LREKTGYERDKLQQEKNDLQKKLNAALQREDQLQVRLKKKKKKSEKKIYTYIKIGKKKNKSTKIE